MSQRNRITRAAIMLVAALFLAAPKPTFAAWIPEGGRPLADAWERAWSRVASLLLPRGGASPGLTARWEKEGGMIDPNGQTHPAALASAPPPTSSSLKSNGFQ